MRKIILALALVALTSSSAFAAVAGKANASVDRAGAGSATMDRTHSVVMPK